MMSCLARESLTESWPQGLGSLSGSRAIVNNSCLITLNSSSIITLKLIPRFIESERKWRS
jgi:hypothetical protein